MFRLPTMQLDHLKFGQRSLTVNQHGQHESSQVVEKKILGVIVKVLLSDKSTFDVSTPAERDV